MEFQALMKMADFYHVVNIDETGKGVKNIFTVLKNFGNSNIKLFISEIPIHIKLNKMVSKQMKVDRTKLI